MLTLGALPDLPPMFGNANANALGEFIGNITGSAMVAVATGALVSYASGLGGSIAVAANAVDKIDGVAGIVQGVATGNPIQVVAGALALIPGITNCFVEGSLVHVPGQANAHVVSRAASGAGWTNSLLGVAIATATTSLISLSERHRTRQREAGWAALDFVMASF